MDLIPPVAAAGEGGHVAYPAPVATVVDVDLAERVAQEIAGRERERLEWRRLHLPQGQCVPGGDLSQQGGVMRRLASARTVQDKPDTKPLKYLALALQRCRLDEELPTQQLRLAPQLGEPAAAGTLVGRYQDDVIEPLVVAECEIAGRAAPVKLCNDGGIRPG